MAGRGGDSYKDAIFVSPHKFIGGPSTPGVLVVRRELLVNRVPTVPGGGTVAFVNPSGHQYLDDPAHREEGGTPAIIVTAYAAGFPKDDLAHFELLLKPVRPPELLRAVTEALKPASDQ